ncbi:MAG: SDR family NAD(P)-dependent oxidoreductase [Pseudomonadota bacterium]
MTPVAVITGATRGLGLETARQLSELGYSVVLTGRDEAALHDAARTIGPDIHFHFLDASDDESVAEFFGWLLRSQGRIDVLVNNAGRIYGAHSDTVSETEASKLAEAVNNNALSAYRMMRRALPMMLAEGSGRMVNVSSGMGALTDMGSGALPYRLSKTAMNTLTILVAHSAPDNVKVNAVCPGWVRTDMGGPSASRSVEEGAKGIIWAATLPEDGPTGGFFRDGKPIPW